MLDEEWEQVTDGGPRVRLTTANGNAASGQVAPMQIPVLEEDATPNILPATSPALSAGKRCMARVCSFAWPAGETPFITLKSSR